MTQAEFEKKYVNKIVCSDCLKVMKDWPDNCVDLVLTDPPYGLTWLPTTLFGKACPQTMHLPKLQQWDKRPPAKVFDEIQRIGSDQIIWGGNYFGQDLPDYTSPFIWDKQTGNNTYADGELAYTSLKGTLRIFRHQWCGAFKDSERGIVNEHPTQKPIALMIWCIQRANMPDLILDPFCGSGTTCVAAKMLGRRYIGIDISPDYCKIAEERLRAVDTGVPVKEARAGQTGLFEI